MTLTTVLLPQTAMAASISSDQQQQQLQQKQMLTRRSLKLPIDRPSIPWLNPCGGIWSEKFNTNPVVQRRKKILLDLKRSIRREYNTISANKTPAIDKSKIRAWSHYEKNYTFLPSSNVQNSNIALRTWHQHMQVYIASFNYLHLAKLAWDMEKTQYESSISMELKILERSSTAILCDIETALNNTMPMARKSRRHKIKTIPPRAMQKRLRFQTNLTQIYSQRLGGQLTTAETAAAPAHEVSVIDLKFLKHHYFAYLRDILKKLRLKPNSPDQISMKAEENAISKFSSSPQSTKRNKSNKPTNANKLKG